MALPAWDPCLTPIDRKRSAGRGRIRVVEVLATGTSGGAQEHVFGLMGLLDDARFDASIVSLSAGSAVRKLERAGFPVTLIDEPDDAGAVAALAAYLARVRPDVVHSHMYRADVVATKAVLAMTSAGHARPYLVSTVHSSRVRSTDDRETLRCLTPEIDQLIAVSKAIVAKIADERPGLAPLLGADRALRVQALA
jgi:hypothetical protein